MSTIQTIKDAQLAARKARDGVRASFLTTLLNEVVNIGKSTGDRETTDVEALEVMRKIEKNCRENIRLCKDSTDEHRKAFGYAAKTELTILEEFLPQKVSDEQVRKDIAFGIETANLPLEMKSMGAISKALRQAYGEQYDGAQVSTIFKSML